MAAHQEPEVQFAQRLASNEKPVRTKAIKKLRKYINVRSQKAAGGFTGDELLKLWKGLFYCLWMQDKPLLQEELSSQISSLIHSFHNIDAQLLYLESFLQTFKREWTGIDRLRMDKFFQVVRFMFRQTFELLKRKNWESGSVSRFLELLMAQLLQSGSDAPSGLQLHVLDLYMTELAAVGSAELSADQNLIFIEPFCKTAAKTKDRTLFRAICSSIFSTIIDQAPFAIDELMKEVKAAEDSDSGQASEEDDEDEQLKEKTPSKAVVKKRTGKQINGKKSNEEEEEDDDDDDEDDDELLHLEDSDTEALCDEDVGPILQFDYAALADKLFELASRSSTPSQNRQRLYKIIKVLRDLSEGIFPQDEYPEEVSTDEDDDMFGSRKRFKRGRGRMEDDDEGEPATKKSKASGKKKEASALSKQSEDAAEDDHEPADLNTSNENKKKKRRKKKKKKTGEGGGEGGENAEGSEQEQPVAQSATKETEDSKTQSSVSSVKVTQAASADGQSEPLLLSEGRKQPSVTVTEESSQPAEPEMAAAAVSGKKKKKQKKGLKDELPTDVAVAESQVSAETVSAPLTNEESTPETETSVSKKKVKSVKAEKSPEEEQAESQVNSLSTEEDGAPPAPESKTDATTPAKKKKKKKKKKNLKADDTTKTEADAQVEVEGNHTDTEITSVGEEASPDAATVPLKKKAKKKGKQEETTAPAAADESSVTPLKKKRKNNQKELKTTEEEEGAETESTQVEDAENLSVTTPMKKKKKKKPTAAQVDESKDETQEFGSEDAAALQEETEVLSSAKKQAKKKKRKIPVVFEFEADELEAAASINVLMEEETAAKRTKLLSDAGEPSTPLSTNKSQKKAKTSAASTSDFITFQNNAAIPTPLFCKTKGRPGTPLSSKKKSQTPKSESKKVTFGLKNNKTAEFRKTDRSLLVSPDGSSRVPFDPEQKPKFGVLKSPATPLSARVKKTPTRVKKTPAGPKKASCGAPMSTPKRRPSAADFF